MTKEELEKSIMNRIEIPAKDIEQFWTDFDASQKSAVGRYLFWKKMSAKWPAVKEGTWAVDAKVFKPALVKQNET